MKQLGSGRCSAAGSVEHAAIAGDEPPASTYLDQELVLRAEFASSLFGFYVHIPFCARRCGYCDFATFEGLANLADAYLAALHEEIEEFLAAGSEWWYHGRTSTTRPWRWPDPKSPPSLFQGKSATTLYVGGGTPTLLNPVRLGQAIELLLETSPLEVTVEANPDSLDPRKARVLAGWGVNRVSLGVQSFDRSVLSYLDRTHEPRSIYKAIDHLADAGISNFNLDLIYGAPPETLASWERTLEAAVRCEPTHVSCYALSIERGTPLHRKVSLGEAEAPDPDDQADKMSMAADVLEDAGYRRYEVSSWCLPGYECVHNLIYWGFGRYRGFGSGAHSFDGKERYWNPRHPFRYIDAVSRGSLPEGRELLDRKELILDRVALGMRRSVGIELPEGLEGYRTRRLLERGLAALEGGRLLATQEGMALLNEIVVAVAEDLLDADPPGGDPGEILE